MVTVEDRAGCCAPPPPLVNSMLKHVFFILLPPFFHPPPPICSPQLRVAFPLQTTDTDVFLVGPSMSSSQRSFSSLLRALCYLSRLATPIVALCGVAAPHMLPFSWFEESQCFGSMLFTYMDCVCEHVCTHSPNSENDLRE